MLPLNAGLMGVGCQSLGAGSDGAWCGFDSLSLGNVRAGLMHRSVWLCLKVNISPLDCRSVAIRVLAMHFNLQLVSRYVSVGLAAFELCYCVSCSWYAFSLLRLWCIIGLFLLLFLHMVVILLVIFL